MAAPWRLANALVKKKEAVNAKWPGRDKSSDGTIGDAAHASRNSDHNPWIIVAGVGVVRADDIDVDGIDAAWYAERLRQMGAAGDPRLTGGGYVIYNRRITAPDFSGWKAYNGSNPHTHHVHTSYSKNAAGFDSIAPWDLGVALAPAAAVPATSGDGVFSLGESSPEIADWQRFLRRSYSRFGWLADDGVYGPATKLFVEKVQAFRGIKADGISGPATFRATNYR